MTDTIRPSTRRPNAGVGVAPRSIALGVALALGACGGGGGGGGDGGGGTSGAGLELRGTVPDNRRLASRQLEIRAASGERSAVDIGADGRFSAETLVGTGPWLLRASFGVDDRWYAMLHAAGANVATNVHAYTDLAVRNLFAVRGQSVDAVFDDDGALAADSLPDAAALDTAGTAVAGLLEAPLAAYDLQGTALASVDFAADGGRIDDFLARNPALIENGAFTILSTDPNPARETLTTIADAVPLAQDLLAPDGTAPEVPSSLRALPSALDEIVLVWEASRDDVAVAGYEVYRDDALVATTPYPVFVDSPLAPGVEHDYEIRAVDVAGNFSETTPTVAASPLAEADIDETPPPAPTALEVTATNASARLRWTQADVADVATFKVFRGEGEGMLERRSRVTSTATTDVDLAVATRYCYRVSAVDAAENESPQSEPMCATTTGDANVPPPRVTPIATPVEPAPMPTAPAERPPASADLQALLAIEVGDLPCALELDFSVIEGPVTLDAPCYRAPDGIRVAENGQLVVAAGTVLKFGAGRGLDVNTGGSLSARGTPDAPVVFSSIDRTPGFWQGVSFAFSNSSRNALENVVIEYAGASRRAALRVLSNSSSLTRLAVDGVVLRRGSGAGFDIPSDTFRGTLDSVVSTENAFAGTIGPETAALLGTGGRFEGNAEDVIVVDQGSSLNDVERATVWPSTGVPFVTDNLFVEAPLEIPAGTELRMRAGGQVNVDSSGSLRAVGTAGAPILFTGLDPTPGFWQGVRFAFSNSANNRLEHVTIEYGGGAGSQNGGLVSRANSSNQTRLAVADLTVRFSEGPGFLLQRGTRLDGFDRVTSTANGVSGLLHPDALPSLGSGLALGGNADDRIALYDATVATAVTWPALGVPYTFGRLDVDAALRLSPGTTLLANAGGVIDVGRDGSLSAVGTAAAPIVVAGRNPVQGHWQGVTIASGSQLNRLEHVELRHGGGVGNAATSGNLVLGCFGAPNPAAVTVANSVIADSFGWGIYRRRAEGCTTNIGANVTYSNNAQGDVNPL